jgi:predicted Zn-dependent protease/TolB-like protein
MQQRARYWAFISYSHADKSFADWLHRELEKFPIPGRILLAQPGHAPELSARLKPVFLDRLELASSHSLDAAIADALRSSYALVVIASPNAVASPRVAEEILLFKRLGREQRIFTLIADGRPRAAERGLDPTLECLPEPLRYLLGPDGELSDRAVEPFAADARGDRAAKRAAVLRVIAGILEVGYDAIAQRDRQQRLRRSIAGAAAVTIAAVAGGTVAWLRVSQDSATIAEAGMVTAASLPLVAVEAPRNLTGEPGLEWLGEGLASLVRDELTRSKYLMIAAPGAVAGADNASESSPVTHALGGEVIKSPEGLVLTVRLTDVATGRQVAGHRLAGKTPEALIAMASSVAMLAKQGLNVPASEQVDVFAADFAATHMPAYEAYVAGLQSFVGFEYEEARRHFQTALEREPSFAMARYRLAHTIAVLGDTVGAIEQIDIARRDAAQLPDRERRYIAAATPYFGRDYAAAESQYEALLQAYPYEREARQLLVYVLYDQEKHEEALEQARALSIQEPGSEVIWGAISELNLRLRRFDDAGKSLRRYVELAPRNPNAWFLSAEHEYLRANLDAAAPLYAKALALDPTFGSAHIRLAQSDALRGDPGAAISRFSAVAGDERISTSGRLNAAFEWVHLLRAAGECEQALRVLEQFRAMIAEEGVREALALSLASYCESDLAQHESARRYAAQAVQRSPGIATRYLFAKGMAELAAGDLPEVERTIEAIAALVTDPSAADQTERKAARYLEGRLRLARGDATGALEAFDGAVAGYGYEYDLYQVGRAAALESLGDVPQAAHALELALAKPDPDDPRLDLELARKRARARLAEFKPASTNPTDS